MPRVSPIFRLPYLNEGEVLTGLVERTRFVTIDRQLEALFTFLGNGVITGWNITRTPNVTRSITISPGSGVVASVAAASSDNVIINNLTPGTAAGDAVNYIYAQLLGHTPYTAQVDFIATTTFYASEVYLPLGRVIVGSDNTIKEIDISEGSGRKPLTFIEFVLNSIKEHLHTGAAGQPSKIDLQDHVKGILDTANIGNIPAAKITGGTISPDRFKLSHNDLDDIGNLSHEELDSLVEKLQKVNRLLFGDVMSANLMQLYLSFKHVWPQVDEFSQNFVAVIPGIANNDPLNSNTFIDDNASTAEIDYINHRVRGRSLSPQEAAQATINSEADWRAGSFDEKFIRIIESNSAYGYGYGGGEGIDFFNVFETTQFNFITGTGNATTFAGNNTGYGFGTFESDFAGTYGYGYGFEYAVGFPTTLTSTIVTLNPLTQTLEVHNKSITDTPDILDDGNTYDAQNTVPTFARRTGDEITSLNRNTFLRALGENAVTPRRSDSIDQDNDGVNNVPDDLFSFFSYDEVSGSEGIRTDSDQAAAYIVWNNTVDLTENNIITFLLAQVEEPAGPANNLTPFDDDWVFDHSFQLIIEATNAGNRLYYLFKTDDSGDRFFIGDEYTNVTDVLGTGTKYFADATNINGRREVEVTAQISTSSDVEFLTGFEIANPDNTITTDLLTFPTFLQSVTGIILYTNTTIGHDNNQDGGLGATYIQFPQGRRTRLEVPSGFDAASRMLADIDQIYIGGPSGFSDNENNNDIRDLIISFPDRVDFESISWIADDGSSVDESIVYIQVNRLEEDPSDDFRIDPIYTDNTARGQDLFPTSEIRNSGSDFTDIFSNIRGIRLRVVLLPTSDRRVAPTINSITVNYVTQTLKETITITSLEDWLDAREIDNTKVIEPGTIEIDLATGDVGKIDNILYGTDRSIVEVDNDYRRVVKRYSGSNLPLTVTQQQNSISASLSGFVTDLKKLNNGDIVALDRDESRIIYLDKNYNVEQVVASEKAFLTNDDAGAGAAGETATLVKAIYNRQLEDNGVLYLVFSHHLDAWVNGPTTNNVKTSQIFVKNKGQTLDFSGVDVTTDVIAADRGIISLKLTGELSNFIESAANPILQLRLDGSTASVKFFTDPITTTTGRIDMTIEKLGTKGVYTGINLVYAPIQGVVAFDTDENDNLMILKQIKPYLFDTNQLIGGTDNFAVWYARFSPELLWTSWTSSSDPDMENNISSILGTENEESLTEPNFFTSNFYGQIGSIQRNGSWLLFTLSGDKKVFITKKDQEDGTKFRQPTEITLPDDGTTPMAARFDPDTITEDDFGFIYVALSDLRRGSTDNTGKSKVIKTQEGVVSGQEVIWTYGAGEDERTTRAVSVNDVHPLVYSSKDGVIIST